MAKRVSNSENAPAASTMQAALIRGASGPRDRGCHEGRQAVLECRRAFDTFGRMKVLTVECPDALHERLTQLSRDGWIASPEQAAVEALRRFLDSHEATVIREHVHADVEWGLRGND